MACPFFMPVEKLENGTWPHPSRLPLGAGWSGHCTAPGHQGEAPSPEELHRFCNLGYADRCPRLPQGRVSDAVRFAVTGARNPGDKDGAQSLIQLRYVCERAHLPVDNGFLIFNSVARQWQEAHSDHRIQRMAECFLQSYVEKMKRQEEARAAS